MGPDPSDAPIFLNVLSNFFADYEIPEKFQAKVTNSFLSAKARAVLAKLSIDATNDYESVKTAILRELQFSSNVYLEHFNMYRVAQ